MRKIRCAIVDDEPLAVRLIESFVARTPFLELSASFTDSLLALERLREEPVDLVFLDIQMADMDGLELSYVISRSTKIIFTTAFREYAFESYEVSALDFLLKPIRYDKFLKAAEKALDWFEAKQGENRENVPPKDVFLKADGEFRRINLSDILFVEGMKDYVRFILKDNVRPVVCHLTMKGAEDTLPADRFMRVSRSHIISLENIRTVDRNLCIYIGDTMIRVTDMYKQSFTDFLQKRLPH